MKYLKGFAFFLWDFFVGDTPELAVGVCALSGVALTVGIPSEAGVILLPATIAGLLVMSVYVGKQQAGR